MSVPAAALPSPLSADQAALVVRLTEGLDVAGLWWLSGYAAGLAQRGAPRAASTTLAPAVAAAFAPPAGDAVAATPLTIVFGSQTGNSRRVAEGLARQAEANGLAVRLLRADGYPLRELKDERLLVVAISTQGDGDPPDDARGFVDFLAGKRAPRLEKLKFAVLGLGDSSYPQFNAIGRRVDARLAELGATRLLPRADADVDVDAVAGPWAAQALERAREELKPATPSATITPLRPAAGSTHLAPAPAAAQSLHDRERPFAAEVLANQRLTGRGSAKDVRHLELSLEGSGLTYQPGDALGMRPVNDDALVDAVLAALRLDGDTAVAHAGESRPLHAWLRGHRELTRLARPFLQRHAERAGPALATLVADADAVARLLSTHQLIDLLAAHPGEWRADELVAALRPLAPRLYSIASSQAVVGAEAHLTVAHVAWTSAVPAVAGRADRFGVASHCLATRGDGDTVDVFVEANERFRLPADGARDIVMIGPGTGVAPFRGFVQERAAAGATGRNWLFFGDRTRRDDFLYQLEWQQALKDGRLARLDLAFSRDGVSPIPHTDVRVLPASRGATPRADTPRADATRPGAPRPYVQQRLREHGRELFAWLENGAHFYVCGATAMARDVDAALREVVAVHGGRDAEGAAEYVDALQQQGRYARDVY